MVRCGKTAAFTLCRWPVIEALSPLVGGAKGRRRGVMDQSAMLGAVAQNSSQMAELDGGCGGAEIV